MTNKHKTVKCKYPITLYLNEGDEEFIKDAIASRGIKIGVFAGLAIIEKIKRDFGRVKL
jgi:hypothetical protein